METALYLLPVTLGETPIERVLPSYNKEIILNIKYFIVEDVRSARRFLKKVDASVDINSLTFYELNKHTLPEAISDYLRPLADGHSMGSHFRSGMSGGCRSGSGCCGHCAEKAFESGSAGRAFVYYLVGDGAGFNGQNFAFNGYLPIDPPSAPDA